MTLLTYSKLYIDWSMRPQLILNVAALSPKEVGDHTPYFSRLAQQGSITPLIAPQPALTSSSHATMMTGQLPNQHGIIANGWYDQDYAKIYNWNRSDRLVQGEKLWEVVRQQDPQCKVANLFWRFCTHSQCDFILTERPTYFANGRKGADVYSPQANEKDRLVERYGPFPFFNFWGPMANLKSSQWIVDVAKDLLEQNEYGLILCYAPGLDYDGQRFGPESITARQTLQQADQLFGELIECAEVNGYDVSVVSDYGFTTVSQAIFLNKVLRHNGYLSVESAVNGELLEPGASKAFAVSDNQAAHIYINDHSLIQPIKKLLESQPGVAEVLVENQSVALGHSRSGQLLAIADQNYWFAYPYWLDEEQAPDFASCVDIFNKPGFDPSEMFIKEGLLGKLHVAKRFMQMKMGIRAPFDVISTRYNQVCGARNIRPKTSMDGATLLTSWSLDHNRPISMEDLKNMWLNRMFSQ